ncbi:SGNH/GDSL hydrolase family protein [bacterium]|nr:SGNH/GDSL hydrolase family protein [bacterium]
MVVAVAVLVAETGIWAFAFGGPQIASTVGAVGTDGGVVGDADSARVEVPPGSVSAGTSIRIIVGGSGPQIEPEGIQLAGDVVTFETVSGALTGDVTVEVPFDPARVGGGPGEVDVFAVVYTDELGWIPALGEADWEDRVVRVRTDHFSTWQVLWSRATLPVGAELQPTPDEMSRQYVALGDSFSSGEGVEPFHLDSSIPLVDECHRSTSAYPELLASALDLSMVTRACSGATISNVSRGGKWREAAQVKWLSDDTQIVTVTVGGNDVPFEQVILTCLFSDCISPARSAWRRDIEANVEGVENRLEELLSKISSRAPNARVYIMGYPHMFPRRSERACLIEFNPNEREWFWRLTETLNDRISSASRRSGVIYVPPPDDFAGHEACGSQGSWFNGLIVSPDKYRYSLHPTGPGHEAMAEAFADATRSSLPASTPTTLPTATTTTLAETTTTISDLERCQSLCAGIECIANCWKLDPGGIGPIRVGMSLNEAIAASGFSDDTFGAVVNKPFGDACYDVETDLGFLLEMRYDRITAIYLAPQGYIDQETREGIRLRSTEEEVLAAYGDRLTIDIHPYVEGGLWLFADFGDQGMVFETNGAGLVTGIIAGESIGVEGCL